jgi:hypothetical protein
MIAPGAAFKRGFRHGDILAATSPAMGETKMKRVAQWIAVVSIVIVLMATSGCDTGTPDPAVRADLERTIDGYLNALAESYTNLDISPLQEWASPNEVQAVRKLLTDLARTGDRIQSTMRGYHIENLEMFREINAAARVVEVWDVVRFDAFTGVEKGRTPDSIQYTILQLRLIDGRWMVVGRSILQRETPVAAESTEGTTE